MFVLELWNWFFTVEHTKLLKTSKLMEKRPMLWKITFKEKTNHLWQKKCLKEMVLTLTTNTKNGLKSYTISYERRTKNYWRRLSFNLQNICPFASQPQENFVKFLLLLGQRFISYLKSDFYGVKLSWLGNEHISLSGHKETKHEQDKKRKPEKELLEHNSMLQGQKVECWVDGALVPWCLGGREEK